MNLAISCLVLFATFVSGTTAREVESGDANPLILRASDLPSLADSGVEIAGERVLSVWAPAREHWNLTCKDGVATLTAAREGDQGTPDWRDLGPVRPGDDGRLRIRVEGASFAPAKVQGNYQTEKQTNTPNAKGPVPALIALSETANRPLLQSVLGLVRCRTGTAEPPSDARRDRVRTNQEGARFQAPETLAAWLDRREHLRDQLWVTLGLRPLPTKTPLNPRVFDRVERDGYTIESVILETFPGFILTGNLYRPIGVEGRKPAMLSPHGHYSDGRFNPDVQMRAIRWAKLGCVVLSYDMVGYGDTREFGHEFLNDRLRRWGISLATLQTWNSVRALDWITSLPDVDASRVGCTGESGGGTQTFLLTAIDDRVKAAAPVVMVSDSFQGGCVCENAAGLRWGTDNVEFAALAAPRPMKLVAATGDWTSRTMQREAPALAKVYQLYGAADRFQAEIFDFPHNYNQTSRNAVYPFLGRWLFGIHDPEGGYAPDRVVEGPQTIEKTDDLRVIRPGSPAPVGLKKPADLEQMLVDEYRRKLDEASPQDAAGFRWEAARRLLDQTLKVRLGLSNPSASDLSVEIVGTHPGPDGTNIHHYVIGRKSVGDRIPVVMLSSPKNSSSRATVVFSDLGQSWMAGRVGDLNPIARALLDRGQWVIAFDPFLVGEAFPSEKPAAGKPETVHFDCYNKGLAAERLQDLATVVAWARSGPWINEVNLLGDGRWGPLALLARPALEGVGRTAIDLNGFDYGDGSGAIPADLDLPGVLQFGGLKSAAALAAPGPLRLFRPAPTFDRAWPTAAYGSADAAAHLRIDAEPPSAEDLARWLDGAAGN